LIFIGVSEVQLSPSIVTSEAIKCGHAIKVKWMPPPKAKSRISSVIGYELVLISKSDSMQQTIYFSREVHSHEFNGLKVNAVYKVNLRAKTSEGLGLSAEEQITTTAGNATDEINNFMDTVVSFCCYCRCCCWY